MVDGPRVMGSPGAMRPLEKTGHPVRNGGRVGGVSAADTAVVGSHAAPEHSGQPLYSGG